MRHQVRAEREPADLTEVESEVAAERNFGLAVKERIGACSPA
jgi:hypothetical protein